MATDIYAEFVREFERQIDSEIMKAYRLRRPKKGDTMNSNVCPHGVVAPHYCLRCAEPESIAGDLKDSGERRVFGTGAQRDRGQLKGRPDLRPVHALHRLDLHMEKGAKKYAARNWELGMPLSEFYNSAARHAEKLLAGYTDEDHEAAWLWNVACFIETRERVAAGLLPAELDDMPRTFAGKEPGF